MINQKSLDTYPHDCTAQPASQLPKKLFKPLFRKFRVRSLLKVPRIVNIEPIPICNANCTLRPIDKITRPEKDVDQGPSRKMVDECLAVGVKCIRLRNYGGPLFTPNVEQRLQSVRLKSQKDDPWESVKKESLGGPAWSCGYRSQAFAHGGMHGWDSFIHQIHPGLMGWDDGVVVLKLIL